MKKTALWRAIGFDIALFVIALDQFSKFWVMTTLFAAMYAGQAPSFTDWLLTPADRLYHPPIEVTSFFNWVMVWNPGVSFGMFQQGGDLAVYGLTFFAVAVAVGFLIWMWREPRPSLVLPVGLIVGGALGNVWDRLRFGAVVDFLDVHANDMHWPAFNVADSAITLGVVLLLIDQFYFAKQSAQPAKLSNEASS